MSLICSEEAAIGEVVSGGRGLAWLLFSVVCFKELFLLVSIFGRQSFDVELRCTLL